MKKILFSIAILAIMAITTRAQTPTIFILQIDSNLAGTDSLLAFGMNISGVPCFLKGQSQRIGTTPWVDTDTTFHSSGEVSIPRPIRNLLDNTTYRIRFVFYDTTYSYMGITDTVIGRTKPLPVRPTIQLVDTVPGLPNSFARFIPTSIGSESFAYGVNATNGTVMTDTVVIPPGSTALGSVSIPSAQQGQYIPSGFLVIESRTPGIAPNRSRNWGGFITPSYTHVNISTLTVPVRYQDSMKAEMFIAVGTAGSANVQVKLYDSTATQLIHSFPDTVMSTSGPRTVSKTGLGINAGYVIKVSASDGVIDTASVYFRTPNVNPPTPAIPPGGTTSTTNSTTVSAFIRSNGPSWPTARVIAVCFTDADGTDTIVTSIVDTGTVTCTKLNKIHSYGYWYIVSAINSVGLVGSTSQFMVYTKVPQMTGTPSYTSLERTNSTTLTMKGVYKNIPAGMMATLRADIEETATGLVDTAIMEYTTGIGPSPDFPIGNRKGGTNYCVTIVSVSDDGIAKPGNTICVTTSPPGNPMLVDITQDAILPSILPVTYHGTGMGNLSILEVSLQLDNAQIGAVYSTSVGPGYFEYPYSWNNLYPNTEYKVLGEVTKSDGSNPSPYTKYFWTAIQTGMPNTPPANANGQLVRAFNLLGQEVCNQDEYGKMFEKLKGVQRFMGTPQIFIVVPVDKDGNRVGDSRKLQIQME